MIATKRLSACLLLTVLFAGCTTTEKETPSAHDILWYQQPANVWDEALPLGNGRLGIMVFGDPAKERIQLNDDSLWPADLGWEEPEGRPEDLQKIRQLLFDGKNAEADAMFVDKFSNKTVVRSHQTLGDLFIDLDHNNITDYRRELDLTSALSSVSFLSEGNAVIQEAFVSHPHNVIALRIHSESPEGLNGNLRLTRPMDEGHPTAHTTIEDGQLVMRGEVTQRSGKFRTEPAPILEGVKFETRLQAEHVNGEIVGKDSLLSLKNVTTLTLFIVSSSSYYSENLTAENITALERIAATTYEAIREDHIRDHQTLYSRLDFDIEESPLDSLPTDHRLQLVKEGARDKGLVELLFQYGRYLLIGSSRQGTNPANLQGLWNPHIVAPWNADYHLNINLQMNYWAADPGNLSELNQPLFDYIDRLVENGKKTAQVNYGCRGSFIPHATDLWAPTWLRAPTAYWGCSVGAGGWLMQHYWDHYEYSGDTTFLAERAFPALESVAQFYSDWLIEDPRDGLLISAPSTSPENRFYHPQTHDPVATCLGSAMDQQVIAEVFEHYLKACEVLDRKTDLQAKIAEQRSRLRPGFVVGSDGRLLEWDREYEEPEPGHRHMSHMYGFHPGTGVTLTKTPAVFEAVRTTLDHRLANGGAGTGWSRAWLINCSARLLDGTMADEHIQLMLQRSIQSNMFDSHPPFQIDGNIGFTSGILEMMVQSHEEGLIRILPALPPSWKSGSIKGVKARNGIELDIYWENNKVKRVTILSSFNQSVNLLVNEETIQLELIEDERTDWLSRE